MCMSTRLNILWKWKREIMRRIFLFWNRCWAPEMKTALLHNVSYCLDAESTMYIILSAWQQHLMCLSSMFKKDHSYWLPEYLFRFVLKHLPRIPLRLWWILDTNFCLLLSSNCLVGNRFHWLADHRSHFLEIFYVFHSRHM